jgi:hypothetical protein
VTNDAELPARNHGMCAGKSGQIEELGPVTLDHFVMVRIHSRKQTPYKSQPL